MNWKWSLLPLFVVVVLSGCATIPTGPSVLVWPAPGKPLEVFQADDAVCRQFASRQVGVEPSDSANKSLASAAAVGTVLGVGLGAAIGAATGQVGVGLGIGAAGGALLGTGVAMGPSSGAGWEVQRRYDNAYMQCMYTKGNQVPGAAVRTYRRAVPPPAGFAPPPYGAYPPPPPP